MPSRDPDKRALKRRLYTAMAIPIVLLLLLGLVLGRQILRMTDDAHWVDHSDQVIAAANETVKQIIDQETAIRGYLLTEDPLFLGPYERAHPQDGFAQLHQLTTDHPEQQARFDEIKRRHEEWHKFVVHVVDGSAIATGKAYGSMRDRKVRMDAIREGMARAIATEETLRNARAATSLASTETTKALFVGLLLLLSMVLAFLSHRQLTSLATTFGVALDAEKAARDAVEAEAWLRDGQTKLVDELQGEKTVEQLGELALATLAERGGAQVGAFFTRQGDRWKRRAGFALDGRSAGPSEFADGEGLVGRAARSEAPVRLDDVPKAYLSLRSGTGETEPHEIVLVPARVEGETLAVVELGFLKKPSARAFELLERIGENVALAVRSAEYRRRLRDLLEEAQRQAEELQTQQEELRVANEELEAQTTALKTAQQQLETQAAELEQTNDNLVEQAQLLENHNRTLAETKAEITAKAEELERASAFKSEFLSNMSHELRTPLNSTLILAKILADNKDGNLTEQQVSYAETIYSAGNDLLALISDILDLSKIESGNMEVRSAIVPLPRLRETLVRLFEPVAKDKGLRLTVDLDPSAGTSIETDPQRLEQILKNLVANALKFTERGAVTVTVAATKDRTAFTVEDSGIGIPEGQQKIIFEAFRQADGTTNRKYGGTGLGLSISREFARLLGGDITLTSTPGKGSRFTLSLPRVYAAGVSRPVVAPPPVVAPSVPEPEAPDSGDEIVLDPDKRTVLLIEDDEAFAKILVDVATEAGFQTIHAPTARRGFRLATRYRPTGIVLDVKLPDHTGLSVLDRLKRDPATRHIPVHVISAHDYKETALSMGAAGYILKPVQRAELEEALRALEARSSTQLRRILVVDDDPTLRASVKALLDREDIEIDTASTVGDALELLRKKTFDCVVTDLGLPDHSGYELLETMATEEPYSVPPVIVYTGRALTPDEEQRLRKYSRSIIVKGARSPERLLDEVTLFLHQVESKLPPNQQRILEQTRNREAVFEGRKILVVEDDVRNVFALTSLLEPKGAVVAIARNGKEALAALERDPEIDLVLMDVMMPEMDGLEATRRIRSQPRWSKLPIIALTAKAMPDDQERCVEAGANDYVAKPLDVEMLLSLLRVWLPKNR